MTPQHAAQLRDQIARQTAELADYQRSIDAATANLTAANAAVQPAIDRTADLEKQLQIAKDEIAANAAVQPAIDRTADLEKQLQIAKDEIAAGQPAIQAATSVLDGLTANAEAIRKAIATCEELLKQPITEDDPPVTALSPGRVPTAALLIVLRKRGLREQFDSVCTSLPPEQQEYVKEMLQMPYTRRDHPLVAMVQQAFGWTDAQADDVFAEADAI